MREGSWRFLAAGADMYGLSPAWQYDEAKELRAILKNMQEKLEKPAVSESAESKYEV